MEIKTYYGLNEDLVFIRKSVFMIEQGFKNEFEEFDEHCIHLVLYIDEKPAGCLRYFKEEDHYVIGRVAMIRQYRHHGYASILMNEAHKRIKELNGNRVILSAQCTAVPFYASLGYHVFGNKYLDEHCPHIHMELELK